MTPKTAAAGVAALAAIVFLLCSDIACSVGQAGIHCSLEARPR